MKHLSSRRPSCVRSARQKLWHLLIWSLVIMALFAGSLLLVGDLVFFNLGHAPLSAAPLLLIGTAYLSFQALSQPGLLDLCQALLVSAAFLLWGVDQLLPSGRATTLLGDIVITLYVIDLGWTLKDRLKGLPFAGSQKP